MKDRIPTYPGRVEMIPVAGQPNIFDLRRADQPVEEGTDLNKATLLTDETAEAIKQAHPEAGDVSTVNEALKALSGGGGGIVPQDHPPENHKMGWVDTSVGGVLKYWDETTETWVATKTIWG